MYSLLERLRESFWDSAQTQRRSTLQPTGRRTGLMRTDVAGAGAAAAATAAGSTGQRGAVAAAACTLRQRQRQQLPDSLDSGGEDSHSCRRHASSSSRTSTTLRSLLLHHHHHCLTYHVILYSLQILLLFSVTCQAIITDDLVVETTKGKIRGVTLKSATNR